MCTEIHMGCSDSKFTLFSRGRRQCALAERKHKQHACSPTDNAAIHCFRQDTHTRTLARTHTVSTFCDGRYLSGQFWIAPCGRARPVAACLERPVMWCNRRNRKSGGDVMRVIPTCRVSKHASYWSPSHIFNTYTPLTNLKSLVVCMCVCSLICMCANVHPTAISELFCMLFVAQSS